MHVFEGDTADQVWQMAASKFREGEDPHSQSGRGGTTRELLHVVFSIQDPRQRWVVSRRPSMNPAFAIVEVVWILNGRKDSSFLNYWNPKLPQFAGHGPEYHGAYGYRLRRQFKIDQLERAYQAFMHNSDGRQIVLQIWNPETDLPDSEGRPAAEDIPCNVCALLKVRNGKLEWFQVMRSNDLFLGLPHNLVQFTCLQEVLAGWLNVELGTYNQVSDSLHVYERDAANLDTSVVISCQPNNDSLCLPKEDSDRVLSEMNLRIEAITNSQVTQSELRELASTRDLTQGFQNLLLIVAADGARRRGWLDLAHELVADCTNPALKQVWAGWLARCQAR